MSEIKQQTTDKTKKLNLRYQRDKDREKVRGIFHFYEVPGGMMSFVYKAYKEDEVERYDLVDGQVYTLPLGVAKHLNNDCWYPIYNYIKGEEGTQGAFNHMTGHVMRMTKKIHRCGFQSLEFVDVDDLSMAPTAEQTIVNVEIAKV